jgi:DNA-binding transcriptional LysR family regulator
MFDVADTLPELQVLLEVSRSRNFREAGSRLGLSQAAVSLKLKRLEERLGRSLFDEIGKKKRPNDFALALCRDFEPGLRELQSRLELTAARYQRAEDLVLRIAGRAELFEWLGSRLEFAGRLELLAVPGLEAVALLREKKADVALSYGSVDSTEFMSWPLLNSKTRFVVAKSLLPRGARLADLAKDPAFLEKLPALQYRTDTDLLAPWLRLVGARPRPALLLEDWRSLLRFAELGFGYTILPDHLVLDESKVAWMEIPEKVLPGVKYTLLFRKSLLSVAPLAKFLRSLKSG